MMFKKIMNKFDDITIIKNESMARHTSWRAGGVAKQYVQSQSLTALAKFIATLDKNEKILWLGLGSNTLVRDAGFDGTVIATQGVMTQLELIDKGDSATAAVYVGAGVASAKLARFCSKKHLTGAEFFAGIPGLVGGALAMNAGAFGGETWPLIVELETLNRNGEIQKRSVSEFEYGYRFVNGVKKEQQDEWFVAATLRLNKKSEKNNTVDIKQLLAKRAVSQPTGVASCGSVFRNPTGHYAAQLIEDCNLKGKKIGGATVSEKHANFIINEKNATASDIETLIELIQKAVKDKHGITLQTEVKIVGDKKQ
ncbi:UDP-N-acetylenolpyruvoylglucosamine reductase [hydrothermal vent metagenome]|uniref:UDP-N-acetylmuramate dehydrogenase n=1 Tax=hydrothermal vent metagenome TaxID=652676 RepID=A0A3B0WJV9_9ZZZZ